MAPNRSSFVTLNNSASQGISNTPQAQPYSNGKHSSLSQHLRPEEVLIGNGSFSDPAC
jgi:hypothetical protein